MLAGGLHSDPPALEPLLIGRRYRLLAPLGEGGMGKVFKALDRLTGRTVALKQIAFGQPTTEEMASNLALDETLAAGVVSAAVEAHTGADAMGPGRLPLRGAPVIRVQAQPAQQLESARQRLALALEFCTLATMSHPNIVSVMDYGFDEYRRPYFTMELLADAQPLLTAAAGQPLADQIDLLIQVLTALSYLHRREIVHRDIKPSNVLAVRAQNGQGWNVKVVDFGLALVRQNTTLEASAIGGTLAYLAPEIFRGAAASVASDLYAVGVMAFEMLVGTHPFDADGNPGRLIQQILHDTPDLTRVKNRALAAVLQRALAKLPSERPTDARTMAQELAAAAALSLPPESVAVRDSFLVAAQFIGRDAELAQLTDSLTLARAGQGSAWLLGGHSGIGKSRLLQELRSIALVDGVLVVTGQSVPVAGSAYQAFVDALRALVLHADLDDHQVSVLGTLIPNLGEILERPTPAPCGLDPLATQLRLTQTLMVLLFKQPKPVLLLLEDLQWADAESLVLLRDLARQLRAHPLMIVATFRDEEAPNLPSTLPDLRLLRLGRLSNSSLQRLCESMLGPASRSPGVMRQAEQESEGNTYFLIELMREMAEESGLHRDSSRAPRPHRQGGVQQLLNRRLEKVPPSALPLLRLAAVAGRQIDLPIVSILMPHAATMLQGCADVGVLERADQKWRFCHDKLREAVLAAMSDDNRRELHLWLTEVIVQFYPDRPSQAARLAYHHHEAGQFAEAAELYALAGETAMARGALLEGTSLLQKAVALHAKTERPQMECLRVFCHLALSYFALGQLAKADEAVRRAFALAGQRWPAEKVSWAAAGLRAALEQVLRRAGLSQHSRTAPDSQECAALTELLRLLPVAEIYVVLGRPQAAVYCWLHGLNLAESIQDPLSQAYGAAGLSYVLAVGRLHGPSQRYMALAEQALAASPNLQGMTTVRRVQSLIAINAGQWPQSLGYAAGAIRAAQELGDPLMLSRSLTIQAFAHLLAGDVSTALEVAEQIYAQYLQHEHPDIYTPALGTRGVVLLRQGEYVRAEADLAPAFAQAESSQHRDRSLLFGGFWALCALRQGNIRAAEGRAASVLHIMQAGSGLFSLSALGLCAIAEVYLHLGEQQGADTVSYPLSAILKQLKQLALHFAAVEPTAQLYFGRSHQLRGHPTVAALAYRLALRSAERLCMPYEQAQAHYFLGRQGQPSSALCKLLLADTADSHFAAAEGLFAQLGAAWDVARVRQARKDLA